MKSYVANPFFAFVHVDGAWLMQRPLDDATTEIDAPTGDMIELALAVRDHCESAKTEAEILAWLAERTDGGTELLAACVEFGLVTTDLERRRWMTGEVESDDVAAHVALRNLVRRADYADPTVLARDEQLMRTYAADPPPAAFASNPGAPRIPLEHPATDARAELGALLFFGFGVLREVSLHDLLPCALKAVPSKGARHVFEAYVVAGTDSELLEEGLYHYEARDHVLERLPFETPALSGTHLVVTMIFERMQWRYRHSVVYKDLFHDLGHVVETLHRVATDRGLALSPSSGPALHCAAWPPLVEEPVLVLRLERAPRTVEP